MNKNKAFFSQPVKKLLLAGGLLILVSFACLPTQKKVVVCFGDSITHGAQVDGHSWVWYLQQNEKPTPYTYVNAGRSGRKTADREELLPVLEKYPAAAMYVFFLGVNDLKNGNDTMVAGCLNNMQWMIDQVREKDPKAKILLLAPSDINTEIMNEINKKKQYNTNTRRSLQQLEGGYRELARKNKTGFLSLLHVVPRLAYADGLHPDKEGQQALYKAIGKKIISYDGAQ
ncbi:SGNH/GDSL hydrolase family protein [Arachidicoccus terrestris]|uniref:SGNH/GDSL hydrolase family protein n=1 Tax=Arachidicoccus terrestris TaxID=2875539 RepID=UPI001CC5E227|nr:SGNH/GDSL hydrolase family protein [Arachidicoccus terrestris]UAY54536.1 SGNH/GDSL hydrolase family protein [Arachidicoccus terrestris]